MQRVKETLKTYFWLTLGTLLVVIGVYFFKFPNNFSTGGVTGISIILGHLIPNPVLSPGNLVLIINVALLVVGFAFVGREFGFKTVYCSMLMSLALSGLEIIYPMAAPFTDQPLLELVYAILFPAVGSAILFNMKASTGGTDIVAMLIRKYTGLETGRALMIADLLIVLATAVVFGIRTGLFALLGLLAKALVVDSVIESINLSKYFIIVTEKPDELCVYIHDTLHRAATIWESEGSYTHQKKHVLLVAMSRAQATHLRAYVKEVDPSAFIVISNTSDIIGKGFRALN